MKILWPVVILVLGGCQSPERLLPVPAPVASPPVEARAVVLPDPALAKLEATVRRQAQTIEALLSQNDALAAQLAAVKESAAVSPPSAAPVVPTPPVPAPSMPAPVAVPNSAPAPASAAVAPLPPSPTPEPILSPNAEGVIDLTAAPAGAGEPVNPFTVRAVAKETIREVTIQMGGIVAGPTACAVINDRLVEAGESVESLEVERIEPDAVILRRDGRRLRLPVSEKPVRVRMAL